MEINSGFRWVKNCIRCKQDKFREDFYERDYLQYGLSTYCKKCLRICSSNSAAKRKGSKGSINKQQWEMKISEFDYRCCYCGIYCGDNPTKDHFIPIKLGGSNHIDNIVPSCLSCNSSKGYKFPYSWILQRFGKNHPMLKYQVLKSP